MIGRKTGSLLKYRLKASPIHMMTGPFEAPLVVLQLGTLPTALILKADRVWEAMDFGEKILLTKGIVLDSKIPE